MTQTIYDLARKDGIGHGVPTGDKAEFICDCADEHMDTPVVEFCENVVGTQVSPSYVRKVLKEQNPAAFGIGVDKTEFC